MFLRLIPKLTRLRFSSSGAFDVSRLPPRRHNSHRHAMQHVTNDVSSKVLAPQVAPFIRLPRKRRRQGLIGRIGSEKFPRSLRIQFESIFSEKDESADKSESLVSTEISLVPTTSARLREIADSGWYAAGRDNERAKTLDQDLLE
uniref:Uncharacterized protein n=1 Tax=Vespula pensylvanica TaxID=30213 RepID=A0A834UDZ8_VESPE|nr:hypothetical protein H0235_002131 [Vespula pensylvanica]